MAPNIRENLNVHAFSERNVRPKARAKSLAEPDQIRIARESDDKATERARTESLRVSQHRGGFESASAKGKVAASAVTDSES